MVDYRGRFCHCGAQEVLLHLTQVRAVGDLHTRTQVQTQRGLSRQAPSQSRDVVPRERYFKPHTCSTQSATALDFLHQ